jgi:RNA 2',3'-cyclic 3'-phosphodiesterase
MKRLFAAIKIHPSAEFLRVSSLLRNSLQHEHITWVDSKNTHLTLKFFGETDEARIPAIRDALAAACSKSGIFTINIHRTGIFGSRYDPRVIWFGIDPEPGLDLLWKNTISELQLAGWETDRQNLVPHLTVGRIRDLKEKDLFQKILGTYREIQLQQETVTRVILYESILKREGPTYVELGTFEIV